MLLRQICGSAAEKAQLLTEDSLNSEVGTIELPVLAVFRPARWRRSEQVQSIAVCFPVILRRILTYKIRYIHRILYVNIRRKNILTH